jgi:hypothetical protein
MDHSFGSVRFGFPVASSFSVGHWIFIPAHGSGSVVIFRRFISVLIATSL